MTAETERRWRNALWFVNMADAHEYIGYSIEGSDAYPPHDFASMQLDGIDISELP